MQRTRRPRARQSAAPPATGPDSPGSPAPACSTTPNIGTSVDDLLVQIAFGSQTALARLYDLLSPLLLRLLSARSPRPEDSRTALVETFERIWQTAPSYRPGSDPLAWVVHRTRP